MLTWPRTELGWGWGVKVGGGVLPEAGLEPPCPAGLASPSPSSGASALRDRETEKKTFQVVAVWSGTCGSGGVSASWRGSEVPRAIRSTLIIRMMVGLMGRAALISISSRVMPITDRSTMARSSWFHLQQTHTGVAEGAAPPSRGGSRGAACDSAV